MATIQATVRSGTGKGVARKLRVVGKLPAVMYGAGQPVLNLTLEAKEWKSVFFKEGSGLRTHPQTLQIEGVGRVLALMRDFQVHPVTGVFEHVDFLRFDPNRRAEVMVPVVILDEAICPGVKRGGMVQVVAHELEVHCLAGQIPDQIEISVKDLDIGDSIHIQDVKLPEGAEVPSEDNFTIVAVVGVKSEESGEEESA
ncbi:MAG: 50S ribosomal protein L25/general stress protein Ctc [Magnetococcales bacterium]|nr:50S ribosomal protein L25/general stress protein Ctc [Magnetococcales bacterium]